VARHCKAWLGKAREAWLGNSVNALVAQNNKIEVLVKTYFTSNKNTERDDGSKS
jgi:hypothetical protein